MPWLVKTEPKAYSFDDLTREGRAVWDGVRNPQAIGNLRKMEAGDLVYVYHSGDDKAVVGTAKVARGAYPDPKVKDGKAVVVELDAVAPLPVPVALATLKAESAFAGSPLVRQGRLSVVPLTAAQAKLIASLGTGR
jgi:predicted RNA-binding protein with PUA-like domain